MVGVFEQLDEFLLAVGRRKDVRLAAEFLLAEAGLKQAAGRRAREGGADLRVEREGRERLLREQDLAPRAALHIAQNVEVFSQQRLVDEEIRCSQLHQSTSTGFSTTCHGKPHLFSASM